MQSGVSIRVSSSGYQKLMKLIRKKESEEKRRRVSFREIIDDLLNIGGQHATD